MKQLDEMERMANDIRRECERRRLRALQDDYVLPTDDKENLARALLAVMPVVRSAIELYESDYIDATMGGGICVEDRDLYDKLAAVYGAIDTLRRGMGEE